jgi:hypothetical protein
MSMPPRDPDYVEWLKDNPEPDLQELVQTFGRYDRIPSWAWAQFDRDMEDWQARYRARGK